MKLRKGLLFGGSGQLGEQVLRRWRDFIITAPARAEVDTRDASAVADAIEKVRPDIVINCTAYNDVAGAEARPEEAMQTNALAVDVMAREAARHGAVFLTVSTDYVFDGTLGREYTESDAPHPLSAYGISKLCGELLVERLQSAAYIIRTCGVYGTKVSSSKGYTFIDRILAKARAGEPLQIVNDQIVSPTYAGDLAEAMRKIVEAAPLPGIYHAVNEGPVSWYDFARDAVRQAGLEAEIRPVATDESQAKVRRPRYSALRNVKLGNLGISLPVWQDGIAAYLNDTTTSASRTS